MFEPHLILHLLLTALALGQTMKICTDDDNMVAQYLVKTSTFPPRNLVGNCLVTRTRAGLTCIPFEGTWFLAPPTPTPLPGDGVVVRVVKGEVVVGRWWR